MAPDAVTSNADKVAAELNRWVGQVGGDITKAARPFGESLRALVASRVPYVSGTLSRSVVEVPADGGVSVGMGDGVPYAGWIEFGGSRGRPHVPEGRYLYPTVVDQQPEFVDVATKAITASIDAYPWSKPQGGNT